MFASEQELVDSFLMQLDSSAPWQTEQYKVEFNYSRGKTDVVVIDSSKEIIAVEAKLNKWKIALNQAYRNLCFANKSYVLLPEEIAHIASQYEYEFERRGIGICSIEAGKIVVIKEARNNEPFQPWLSDIAYHYVTGSE